MVLGQGESGLSKHSYTFIYVHIRLRKEEKSEVRSRRSSNEARSTKYKKVGNIKDFEQRGNRGKKG